jgi:lipopolysaccharide transport system ATP-binding protein
MAAVLNLCPRSIWLRGGEIVADGPTEDVVSGYLQSLESHKDTCVADRTDRRGNQALKFVDIELRNSDGMPVQRIQCGDRMTIALRFECARGGLNNVYVGVGVHGKFDENLFDMTTDLSGLRFNALPRQGTFLCTVPRVPLLPGRYSFNVYCEAGGDLADWVFNAGCIEVEPGDFFGSGKLPHADQGPFLISHSWSMAEPTASA